MNEFEEILAVEQERAKKRKQEATGHREKFHEAESGRAKDKAAEKVSSHDLRRRFAQRLLVDEEINPRVVMQVGGWDSFQAIEPYLNAPTADVVDEAFEKAGFS